MSVIYRGHSGYVQQVRDIAYEHGQGWRLHLEFKGLPAAIDGLAYGLAYNGYELQFIHDGPYTKLIADKQATSESNDQEYYDRFTFTKELLQKSVFELEAVQNEITVWSAATTAPRSEYKGIIEEAVDLADEDRLDLFIPEATYPQAWNLYRELMRGADSYEDEYLVLTRDRVVSTKYATKLPLPDKNVSTIYTTDQLKTLNAIPEFTNQLSWPTAPDVADWPPDTQWGWRSRKRDVRFVEGQKAEINQDWVWAAWSTNLYTVYNT